MSNIDIDFEILRFNKGPSAYLKALPNHPKTVLLVSALLDVRDKLNYIEAELDEFSIELDLILKSELNLEKKLELINLILANPSADHAPYFSDLFATLRDKFGKNSDYKMSASDSLDILNQAVSYMDKDDLFSTKPEDYLIVDILSIGRMLDYIVEDIKSCDTYKLCELLPLIEIVSKLSDSLVDEDSVLEGEVDISDYDVELKDLYKPSEIKEKLNTIATHLYQERANSVIMAANALGTGHESTYWIHSLYSELDEKYSDVSGLNL